MKLKEAVDEVYALYKKIEVYNQRLQMYKKIPKERMDDNVQEIFIDTVMALSEAMSEINRYYEMEVLPNEGEI